MKRQARTASDNDSRPPKRPVEYGEDQEDEAMVCHEIPMYLTPGDSNH